MKDHDPNFRAAQTPGDARDILARLYREIGISAVAAALQAGTPKKDEVPAEAAQPHNRLNGRVA